MSITVYSNNLPAAPKNDSVVVFGIKKEHPSIVSPSIVDQSNMKRRWSGSQTVRIPSSEDSNSEVTSSTLIMSPANSLASTDIGDVDLEFFDLDLNHQGHRNLILPNGYGIAIAGHTLMKSDTSSMSGREDLSPPSSLNGYSADSCDSKKKKGPTPRQQEELCLVCGDRASGYHYNALTCEGCKGFFRRSITKNAVYQCKYGNHCEIDMYMRRKCQECRLKKCLSVGMRPECVVPEVQCAVKRKEKKAQKEKDKPNSTTNGSPDLIKMEPESYLGLFQLSDTEKGTTNGLVKAISPEQEELIHRLVYFQNEYEHPSEEDVKRIVNAPMEGEDQCDVRFRHITEITILTVQLIVEFAKRLPGFDKLLREDQISLLKACSSEVMMFRMARRYDYNTDSILFVNNQPYSRDSYNLAGMGETIEDLLHFCRTMYSMQVDNAEYALLTAIVIFSERPDLIEGWKVEKIQEIYLEALRAYVDNRRKPRPGTVFAKLLSVLTELRTLGNQNSKMCFSLKLKNKKLPPFLAEIWDVDLKT
ncbi:ecdysone receptor isoform X5 [Diorhabda carinulata]|uniref:ecdysone receptor isoform X5 n=1 Tax=Diorhabda carinulata TaxID=1163345 RepID=UPI0025A233FD|nr:ecdysone receptor isoform X5 [Diorhabda carinulata]XP_057654941.1 ecdysone receptor isoform X5 [Diorhabda carinulata]XP_057654942.1 ecdysone receptor isoform X5 [Diorhabda carinulata]XP_057654944.1 ecdysone receptor isoform X5 [Diorhabda carinulata]XP_057654945.1 ecdysone receptor isoform X5 [Diorhabda carinulata]